MIARRTGTVATVMSGSVVSVRPDATCADIAELLYTFAIGAVPVLDDNNTLVGIVSAADLFRDCAVGPSPGGQVAADVMTRDVVTIAPSATVDEAASLLRRQGRRWLPVIQDGQVVGIVSRSDLLRVLLPTDDQICDEILSALAGSLRREAADAVHVEVRAGVVTLSGRLPNRSDAELAVRTVGLLDGVSQVRDRMRVEVEGSAAADLLTLG